MYRQAAVVLLPGEEDFGIVPLEAQACGRPVVALARGGALETVIDGQTGTLVAEPTVDAFAAGILATLKLQLDSSLIRRHAEQFGRERFGDDIESAVRQSLPASGLAS